MIFIITFIASFIALLSFLIIYMIVLYCYFEVIHFILIGILLFSPLYELHVLYLTYLLLADLFRIIFLEEKIKGLIFLLFLCFYLELSFITIHFLSLVWLFLVCSCFRCFRGSFFCLTHFLMFRLISCIFALVCCSFICIPRLTLLSILTCSSGSGRSIFLLMYAYPNAL